MLIPTSLTRLLIALFLIGEISAFHAAASEEVTPLVSLHGVIKDGAPENFALVRCEKDFWKATRGFEISTDLKVDFTKSFAVVIVTSKEFILTGIDTVAEIDNRDLRITYTPRYITQIFVGIHDKMNQSAYAVLIFPKSDLPTGNIVVRCPDRENKPFYEAKKSIPGPNK